jgi:hypothetical protein
VAMKIKLSAQLFFRACQNYNIDEADDRLPETQLSERCDLGQTSSLGLPHPEPHFEKRRNVTVITEVP